jgi:hypothetical protein
LLFGIGALLAQGRGDVSAPGSVDEAEAARHSGLLHRVTQNSTGKTDRLEQLVWPTILTLWQVVWL